MRNVLATMFICLLLAGCTPYYRAHSDMIYGIDFNKYYEKGFWISNQPYYGDVEPVGFVYYRLVPEALRLSGSEIGKEKKNYIKQHYRKTAYNVYFEDIKFTTLLDSLVSKAQKMGADGISQFKFDVKLQTAVVNKEVRSIGIPEYYEVSGFAFKRVSK